MQGKQRQCKTTVCMQQPASSHVSEVGANTENASSEPRTRGLLTQAAAVRRPAVLRSRRKGGEQAAPQRCRR